MEDMIKNYIDRRIKLLEDEMVEMETYDHYTDGFKEWVKTKKRGKIAAYKDIRSFIKDTERFYYI